MARARSCLGPTHTKLPAKQELKGRGKRAKDKISFPEAK